MVFIKSLSQFSIEKLVYFTLEYLIEDSDDDNIQTFANIVTDQFTKMKCVHFKRSNSKLFKNNAPTNFHQLSTDSRNPIKRIKPILNILPNTLQLDFIKSLKEILELNLPQINRNKSVRKKDLIIEILLLCIEIDGVYCSNTFCSEDEPCRSINTLLSHFHVNDEVMERVTDISNLQVFHRSFHFDKCKCPNRYDTILTILSEKSLRSVRLESIPHNGAITNALFTLPMISELILMRMNFIHRDLVKLKCLKTLQSLFYCGPGAFSSNLVILASALTCKTTLPKLCKFHWNDTCSVQCEAIHYLMEIYQCPCSQRCADRLNWIHDEPVSINGRDYNFLNSGDKVYQAMGIPCTSIFNVKCIL